MKTVKAHQKSLKTSLFWALVLCIGLGVSTVAEDSPVYSNKNDDGGINHLFDKGDGRYLYVTPSQGQYNTQHQQNKATATSRQKIVVKRKEKPDFYESRKTNRRGVSFSRMANKVRRTKKVVTANKRSFSTFSEQLRR